MPFSKPLYIVSYMLLTGGVSELLLFLLYYIVDVIHIKRSLILFQWMGMNALMVYVLAACDLFPTIIQGFYWRSPENNLEALTIAQDVVKTMLAKGYVLSKDALARARAFDESHQVSATAAAKAAELSKRIGLTDRVNAGVGAIRSVDETYHVSDTTKTLSIGLPRPLQIWLLMAGRIK